MKFYTAFTLLASCMLQAQCQLLSYLEFGNLISIPCYRRPDLQPSQRLLLYGQVHPMANSMENFLSLVERIEKNGTGSGSQQDAATLAVTLLRRFSIEGVVDIDSPLKNNIEQTTEGQAVHNLLRAIQNSPTETPNTDSLLQTLTDDERCSMYFMLSHSINKTHRQEDGEEYILQAPSNQQRSFQQTNRPREQGVVSLHHDQMTAISLAPVLAGIAFAGGNYQNVTVKELVKRVRGYISQDGLNQISDNSTNPLYAATIAGLVGYLVVNSQGGPDKTGLGGVWSNPLCTMDYRLSNPANTTDVTISKLRGAVDGLLLGYYGRRFIGTKFSLSEILRLYYSPRGLPMENNPSLRLTFCSRVDLFREWRNSQNEDFRQQVQAYAEAWFASTTQFIVQDKNIFRKSVDEAIQQMETAVSSNEFKLTPDQEEWCQPPTTKKLPTETPADVFIVMEADASQNEEQKRIIAALGNMLNLRFTRLDGKHSADGGSLSLFTSMRDTATKRLQTIVFNSNNPSCPGCRVFYDDFIVSRITSSDADVISMLTEMLGEFKNNRSEWPAAPSKVVIYFRYGNLNIRNSRELEKAVGDFRTKLPAARVIGVSSKKETLLQIVRVVSEDVVVPRPQAPGETAKEIKSKIDEVPAILQYSDCRIRPSYEGNPKASYTGFITPGYYQYWAMYPEYFLKSFDIRFTFSSAANSKISVCYSRATSHPEEDKRNCNVTMDGGSSVEIRVTNPCKKSTVYTCAPLYFSVYGGDINRPTQTVDPYADTRCDEIGCTAPDQIKFTIQHTGVSCNGALCLLSSPLQLSLTMLLVLYYILK